MPGGRRCSVAICKSFSTRAKSLGQSLTFHSFPKDTKLRKLWVKKCYRKDKMNPDTAFICNLHFVRDDYEDAVKADMMNIAPKKLIPTAVPSQLLRPSKDISLPKARPTKFTKEKERKSFVESFIDNPLYDSKERQEMFKESEVVCSALKCPSTHKANPTVKFFLFPKVVLDDNGASLKRRDDWGKIVGGLKKAISHKMFLCQYHFPENQFKTSARTSLVKKAMPAFPFGPINPKTKDFCPVGEENRFPKGKTIFTCCVSGCDVNENSKVRLVPFPVHDAKVFLEWTKRLNIQMSERPVAYIVNNCRVCLNHFEKRTFVYDSKGQFERLKPDAVPSRQLGKLNTGSFIVSSRNVGSAPSPANDGASSTNLKRVLKNAPDSPLPNKMPKIGDSFSLDTKIVESIGSPDAVGKLVLVPVGKDVSPDDIRVINSVEEMSTFVPMPVTSSMPKASKALGSGDSILEASNTQSPRLKLWAPEDFGVPETKQKSPVSTAPILGPKHFNPVVCLERLKFDEYGEPLPEESPPKLKKSIPATVPSPPSSSNTKGDILKKLSLDDTSIVKYLQSVLNTKPPYPQKRPTVLPVSPPTSTSSTNPSSSKITSLTNTIAQELVRSQVNRTPKNRRLQPISFKLTTPGKASNKVPYVIVNDPNRKCPTCADKPIKRPKLFDRGVQTSSTDENGEEWADEGENNDDDKGKDNQSISKLLRQNLEVTLMKLFNKNSKSAFSSLTKPVTISDEEELADTHVYASTESLNLIKSATDLCEFNNMKIKMLENILGKSKEAWSEMEEVAVKHVSSVLSSSGIEFFRNVFSKIIQERLEKKKNTDLTTIWSNNADLTEETKRFAIALQMHSSKGYQSMWQIMDLPNPQDVRSWATRSDGSPGFCEKSFKLITEEAYKSGKFSVVFCLSVAEVVLSKDVSWDGEQLYGYTDLGYGQLDHDRVHEATRALVFYGTAMNRHWKLPLGYCLIDEISPLTRANLISQYLCRLDSAGVKCYAVVANCSLTNYETFQALGVETNEESGYFGAFLHPLSRTERVYCFFDVFQVTKLMREYLARCKSLQSKDKIIQWEFVEMIDDYLEKGGIPFDSLEKLKFAKSQMEKDPASIHEHLATAILIIKAKGSMDTVRFFKDLHFFTEVSSSNNAFAKGDLRPVSKETSNSILTQLTALANFLKSMRQGDGPHILFSNRRLPIFMLYLNIRSLRAIIRKVMTNKARISTIPTETLQMANVNNWVRKVLGEKPGHVTPLEFKKCFKKFIDSFNMRPSFSINACKSSANLKPKSSSLGFSYWYSYVISPLESVSDNMQLFLTKNVIETLLKEPTCYQCWKIVSTESVKFNADPYHRPNIVSDLHDMLLRAESILHELDQILLDEYDDFFNMWANRALNSMTQFSGFKPHGHLFSSVAFGEVTHSTLLMKRVLGAYLKLRLCFLTRQEGITFNLGKI